MTMNHAAFFPIVQWRNRHVKINGLYSLKDKSLVDWIGGLLLVAEITHAQAKQGLYDYKHFISSIGMRYIASLSTEQNACIR